MPDETLDATLLTLLACPQDKGPLTLVHTESGAQELYNPRLHRAYPVDNGIPVLLVDEARDITDEEHTYFLTQS